MTEKSKLTPEEIKKMKMKYAMMALSMKSLEQDLGIEDNKTDNQKPQSNK